MDSLIDGEIIDLTDAPKLTIQKNIATNKRTVRFGQINEEHKA